MMKDGQNVIFDIVHDLLCNCCCIALLLLDRKLLVDKDGGLNIASMEYQGYPYLYNLLTLSL